MADVTLRLVWYKMGESYKNLADANDRFQDWYSDFSWRRVDLLDMLFLGWLVAAFVVVGAINLYLRFFGLPKSRRAINGDVSRGGLTGLVSLSGGDTCHWLNSALSWLYLHYNSTPELVDAWIRSLNEQARKHNNGLQIKFERVQPGSLPPKVTRITTDPASKDTLSLHAGVEASEMTLVVSAMQNTPTNLKVTSCDVTLTKLQGQLRIHGDYSQETVQLNITFTAPPVIQLSISTRNYDTSVDKVEVERIIREAIKGASTSINLSSRGGYPVYNCPGPGQMDYIDPSTRSPVAAGRSTPQERRLLVKVIKANGLGDKDFGCTDPYCIVEMDTPSQSHTTSVVKNTVNPFWDEHFLFDFNMTSKQIKFEVYDREKPSGDDFLGRATIALEELRRLPSSRQIIPLTGRPRATTTTSGSVTIEFVFVDSGEAAGLDMGASAADAVSPRRRIETNTRMTPGGTMVTTTTTTTEKPRDHRMEPFYNDSPNLIERPEGMNYSTEYSPYNNRGSSHLEAHDAALSASPEGIEPTEDSDSSTLKRGMGMSSYGGPGSPTFTVTRPDMMSEAYPIPVIKMQDAGQDKVHPDDRSRDTLSLSTTVSIDTNRDKKKSSFASALKKRFGRPKKRSQSADRAFSSSYKETSLLKPPEYADSGTHSKTAEDADRHAAQQDGNLRKARSHSFSSSLKRIFKKKQKDGTSRESSLSRGGASREGSVSHPSPHMSYRDEDYTHEYSYSSSMPAPVSPLSHPH